LGSSSEPRVLIYVRYGEEGWTEPTDVMGSPDQLEALYADCVVDRAGRLHLSWLAPNQGPFGRLYYSWAPATDAMSARSWQAPVRIADGTYGGDLAIDPEGRLHLVYASVEDAAGICHVSSDDNGDSWGLPSCIPREYALRDQESEVNPRLAIDSHGFLHVVWMLHDYSPRSQLAYSSRAVYYARSLDGGQSWSDFAPIDEVESRQEHDGLQPGWGNVTVDHEDRVHIVWVGSADMYRYHQWSGDGGVTWTTPQVMIATGGYNGWQGLAVDAGGELHVAWPSLSGVEYTYWNGSAWSSPVLLSDVSGPHFAQAAVALGNQLHVVWQDHGGSLPLDQPGLIVHALLQTDAGGLEPRPLPTVRVPAGPAATIVPTQIPTQAASLPTSTAILLIEPLGPVSDPASPVLIGVIPAILLLILVVVLGLWKRR